MTTLHIGTQVDIKRTDGRVHSAVVSGLNEAAQSVTVEWFENEETKGKELDIRHIMALNPHLFRGGGGHPPAHQRHGAPPLRQQQPKQHQHQQQHQQPKQQPKQQPQQPPRSQRSQPPAAAQQLHVAPAPAKASPKLSRPAANKGAAALEVENIAQRREQRRQRLDEERMEKQQVAKLSKGHPSYEFGQMIEDYREDMEISRLPPDVKVHHRRITVCVRKRPLSKKEIGNQELDVITIPDAELTVVHEPKVKVDLAKYVDHHQFRFDYAFDQASDNQTVYNYSAKPLVQTIFDNGMATCFAYGQTGSGKTHTMGGDFESGVQDCTNGIYALSAADVFRLNKLPENREKNLGVSCSFFEIYGGKVFDLLNKQKRLRVLEDGKAKVQVVGLSEKVVENLDDVLHLLETGSRQRASGTTSANQHSSRSHAVFQIILRKNNKHRKLWGKFSLIDLAGNERGADTSNADRQTRIEGAEINKSLLALKECIRALSKKGSHTPFRASKLTQVLRDSFIGGKSRTCMIAMISPAKSSCEHSLNTLRYADRVKELSPSKHKRHGIAIPVAELASYQPGQGSASAPADEPEPEPEEAEGDDAEAEAGFEDEAQDQVGPLEGSLARHDLKMLHQSLRARKEGSSLELYRFHSAVSNVVEAEERILEEHRAAMQFDRDMIEEEEKLLDSVDGIDYDVEVYAKKLEDVLNKKIGKLQKLRANLAGFRQQLKDEEQASQNVQKLNHV
eukprot:m.159950 g.159950  ORF g.159950 m.159950 type:complete len:733 (+) comp17614_c1_seq1:304-2502(+)